MNHFLICGWLLWFTQPDTWEYMLLSSDIRSISVETLEKHWCHVLSVMDWNPVKSSYHVMKALTRREEHDPLINMKRQKFIFVLCELSTNKNIVHIP